jgi:hypothetical protein
MRQQRAPLRTEALSAVLEDLVDLVMQTLKLLTEQVAEASYSVGHALL